MIMPSTRGICIERSPSSTTLSVRSFATHALSHTSSGVRSVDDHGRAKMACRAQDTAYLLSEKSLMDINEALADVGLQSRAVLPSEIVLHRFFEEAKSIACVLDLLRKGPWNEEVQQDLKRSGVSLDTRLVTQILRCNIPSDVALSFFQWLKGVRRFKHNEDTYGALLNMLGRTGRLREMQQLFDEMKENGCMVTPVTLSNVMLWYFRAKDMRKVAKYWNTMRRSRTKPSAAIYAAYIDFLVRTKRYTKIAVIFEEMLRADCLPSNRVYAVFVRHLVEIGNVEAAAKILQTMQTMRLVPGKVTYTIVINGFAKAGDVDGALKLLDESKEHFHRPTKLLLPAIHALQEGGKSEEATRLLEEILPDSAESENDMVEMSDEDDDAECSSIEWRAILRLHAGFDVNEFVQALHSWGPKVEEMLEQANVQWGRPLVMRVLKQLRNVDCLWPFFHWLKDKAGFKHDSYSCAVMIQQILKSKLTLKKKSSLVRDLFEGMHREGVPFTAPMFNLVMRHYVASGEGERAFDIFEFMKQFEVGPNSISYALVIQGYAKNHQVERATGLLEEMKRKGFHLNSSTCARFITCLGCVNKLEAAYELFQGVSTSGRSASSVEYKAMMTEYARAGDYAMALQLYDQMRETGIASTQDMYELVMKVLHQAKRYADMNALAQERGVLNFFDGKKKVLQERLLQVLFLFMENVKKPGKLQKG